MTDFRSYNRRHGAENFGIKAEDTNRVLSAELGEVFDLSTARKIRTDFVTSYIEDNGLPVKKGLFELLDYLKMNQYKITVATSSEREAARYNFEKAGVSPYFNQIVGSPLMNVLLWRIRRWA